MRLIDFLKKNIEITKEELVSIDEDSDWQFQRTFNRKQSRLQVLEYILEQAERGTFGED